MDEDVQEELSRLRARAYGPDADIHADAGALARLAELEERERRDRARRAPGPEPARRGDVPPIGAGGTLDTTAGDAVTAAAPLDDGEGEPTPGATDDEGATKASNLAPGSRRRLPVRSVRAFWVWAASVAAVAAVASAATAAGTAFAPVARTAGVAQVDTLEEDPAFEVPSFFGPLSEGARGYRDYHGLTAMIGYQDSADGERSACLYIVDAEDLREDSESFRGGFIFGGCGAGVFAPTAQFVVSDELPEELRARFPVGTSLQFVFDGERVGVFTDAE